MDIAPQRLQARDRQGAKCRSGCGAASAAISPPRWCRIRASTGSCSTPSIRPTRCRISCRICRRCRAAPRRAIVRPAWNDMVLIKRVLDIGAQTMLVAVRAERGGGAARGRGDALSAGGHARHHRQRPRQPLRPGEGLPEERVERDLRAGAGRDPRGAGSRSRRSPRSRASTACSSARPISRPRSATSATGASRGAGGARRRGEAAQEDRQAGRHPHAQRGRSEDDTSTGATPSSRSAPISACSGAAPTRWRNDSRPRSQNALTFALAVTSPVADFTFAARRAAAGALRGRSGWRAGRAGLCAGTSRAIATTSLGLGRRVRRPGPRIGAARTAARPGLRIRRSDARLRSAPRPHDAGARRPRRAPRCGPGSPKCSRARPRRAKLDGRCPTRCRTTSCARRALFHRGTGRSAQRHRGVVLERERDAQRHPRRARQAAAEAPEVRCWPHHFDMDL